MTAKKHAVAYVRVAMNAGAEDDPLRQQATQIREYAERNGYQLSEVYEDVGSGNSEERAGLQQMMLDAQAGQVDVLLLRDPSRLFRKLEQFKQYYDLLRDECGIEVIFTNLEGEAS